MSQQLLHLNRSRIGFHYFPDTYHYRQSDLSVWLPVLKALDVSWLTLVAPDNRAIPEYFICSLLTNGIEPILHQHLSLENPPDCRDLQPLYQAYSRWGVRYITLFDRPNRRVVWPSSLWAQKYLVDRFLDIYLPLSETAQGSGLIPVFPPLEPGGDFWDTSFIRLAAQSLRRRNNFKMPNPWVLSCYAWASNRSVDYGAGGPERWPGVKPYSNPEDEQDHRGFRIYEWYLALAQAELRQPCSIILIGAGSRLDDHADPQNPPINEVTHAWQNLEIAKRFYEPFDSPTGISAEVLACNFWLLSTSANSPYVRHAWFQPNERPLPVVSAFHQWLNTMDVKVSPGLAHILHPTYS